MGGHFDLNTLVNKPQQRLETCLRIGLEFKMVASKPKLREHVHCHVYDRSASNHDQFFHLSAL